MDPQQLNLAITAMANVLSEQLEAEDFEFWSIFFGQLSASMETITALRTLKRGGVFPFQDEQSRSAEETNLTSSNGQ